MERNRPRTIPFMRVVPVLFTILGMMNTLREETKINIAFVVTLGTARGRATPWNVAMGEVFRLVVVLKSSWLSRLTEMQMGRTTKGRRVHITFSTMVFLPHRNRTGRETILSPTRTAPSMFRSWRTTIYVQEWTRKPT